MNAVSRSRIASVPTVALSWNTRPARIDSTIAGVPPSSRCSMSERYTCSTVVDVLDRAAAGHARDAVREQLPARDEDARRARPADELVGRDEHRVLVGQRVAGRVHLDRDVRRRGREVEERQRAVRVEEARDLVRVGHDPGHVGRGRERADLQRPVGIGRQLVLELGEVDVAVLVLADRDHVRDALAPRQLVAVVLVRPDEHDRPLPGGNARPEAPPLVEVGRDPDVEDVDEPVDRGGRARAAEDHGVPGGVAAAALEHEATRLLAEARRLEPGSRGLRVGVRVQRQDRVADVVLDERQAAAGRRVVGVGDPADAVRSGDRLVLADDRGADQVDERVRAGPVIAGPVLGRRGAARLHVGAA